MREEFSGSMKFNHSIMNTFGMYGDYNEVLWMTASGINLKLSASVVQRARSFIGFIKVVIPWSSHTNFLTKIKTR